MLSQIDPCEKKYIQTRCVLTPDGSITHSLQKYRAWGFGGKSFRSHSPCARTRHCQMCLDRPLQKKKYKRRAYYAQSLKLQGVKGHTDMRHARGVYTPQSVYVASSEKQRENVGSKKKRKEKKKAGGSCYCCSIARYVASCTIHQIESRESGSHTLNSQKTKHYWDAQNAPLR